MNTSSPHRSEPPRKNFLVNTMYWMAKQLGRTAYTSPHLFGGSNREKVEWEYREGEAFARALAEYGVGDLSGLEVLDVGCGWGGKMIYLAEHSGLRSITGFDLPGVFEPRAADDFAGSKGLTTCKFKTGYAEAMPVPDASFDLLFMEDVLEHVNDPEKVMAECLRVLRHGGLAIIKFPSFRMMEAHHLDRAITLPGLHYMLPMKTLAAGLNHLLFTGKVSYEPFDEVVSTRFSAAVTRNLNGMALRHFIDIANRSGFLVKRLELMPRKFGRKLLGVAYSAIYRTGLFREFLSSFVLFVGERPT